jgi:murein DD-endopeptidase MepM/ murein hydrolase activator NlpD
MLLRCLGSMALVIGVVVAPGCGSGTSTTAPTMTPTPAQPAEPTYSLAGSVRDAGNDQPLQSTEVDVQDGGSKVTATTDLKGTYSFAALHSSITISVAKTNYGSLSKPVTLTGSTTLDLLLTRTTPRSGPCGDAPDVSNPQQPILSRPFDGQFQLVNHFDHDVPLEFVDTNGYQVDSCGEVMNNEVDGHSGYDFLMPEGTPLLATTDGVIAYGSPDPFPCPVLNGQLVTDLAMYVVTTTTPKYYSLYQHMSRRDFAPGDTVREGQVIGLSGNTGCSTAPHLHFGVLDAQFILVDPYGWEGPGKDPWVVDGRGAGSIWLWKPGQAPLLRK